MFYAFRLRGISIEALFLERLHNTFIYMSSRHRPAIPLQLTHFIVFNLINTKVALKLETNMLRVPNVNEKN